MFPKADFPRLTEQNHRVTSPTDSAYNCIAWAAADTERWWQPGLYWPVAASPDDFGIGILEQAFVALGFQDCEDGALESEFEKVAVYGSSLVYTHIARQLPSGHWTSKLGRSEDIEHDQADDVAGGLYGEIVQFMKRARG